MVFEALYLLLALVVFCFAVVVLRGAPFLPTLRPGIEAALDVLELKKGQTLIELGCGDGRMLIAAAQRDLNVIGYELNPILACVAWLRTRRYRQRVRVIWGDFWAADWPKADAIFTFLLPRYMRKLDKKVAQYSHLPVLLASYAFPIPDRSESHVRDGVHLYVYKK